MAQQLARRYSRVASRAANVDGAPRRHGRLRSLGSGARTLLTAAHDDASSQATDARAGSGSLIDLTFPDARAVRVEAYVGPIKRASPPETIPVQPRHETRHPSS